MNIVQAEENLKKITTKFSKDTFIFDLLSAYNFPKATISKLKIKNKEFDDVVVPAKLHFVGVTKKELDSKFDELIKNYSTAKKAPRFIIVTDYQNLKAYDTKVAEKLDTEIKSLSKHPDFFLPWAGIEKKVFQGENPADVKAAEKLAKLFDLILKDNLKLVEKNRHALNVFLTRILFCFFAEDTDIFRKGLFTESLASHTKADGGDLDNYLQRVFEVLNKKSRTGLPDYLKEFPYVNGGLFAEDFPIPKFSKKSRESLIDLGSDLNWAEINPDIFGSMIQAVVHPDQRAGLGMHYTSVTNIMKVIEPLFLSELKEEFISAKGNKNKLKKLLERIGRIVIFDPACGSGNFLIIAYKELRLLEMDILKVLGEIPMSGITLSNFYGIEIDDFAHEVAKLSLWLAEHQMDVLFNKQFGDIKASLPLKDTGRIICGNAAQLDWSQVCPSKDAETFIIGNPPYLGSYLQDKDQKSDLEFVCKDFKSYKDLDYIACWFIKGTQYINKNSRAKLAFVSTNSICQGEQVPLLWPFIFKSEVEIFFAHSSFRWRNNAKSNAAVICVIIGLRKLSQEKKFLISGNEIREVKMIGPYLQTKGVTVVTKRMKPLSNIPPMIYGSKIVDDGNLILSSEEKNAIIKEFPRAKKYIRKFIGSLEFIRGTERWCLWIEDKDLNDALKIPELNRRLQAVKKFRLKSTEKSTRAMAEFPNRFYYTAHNDTDSIIVPRHSSERRKYVPIGFLPPDVVIADSAQAVYNATPFVFGFISSSMHMAWMRAVAGRLKTDYRYSSGCCYNTFPIPNLSDEQKSNIRDLVFLIISEREKHSSQSLSELYDDEKMPSSLKDAHNSLDRYIDSCYRAKPFSSDEERLDYLFELYEKMNSP